MTVISWSLEFIAGIIAIATEFSNAEELNTIVSLVAADIILNFIIIPSSYNLNNKATKTLISAEGWFKAFCPLYRSSRVQPASIGNVLPHIAGNVTPRPIPTISGNINELLSRDRLGTIGQELNNLSELVNRRLFQTSDTVSISHEGQQSTAPGLDEADNDIELIAMDNPTRRSSGQEVVISTIPKIPIRAWE